jgi:hypothetical protein
MPYKAKVVGRVDIPHNQRIVLDHARLRDEDYSDRKLVQFCTIGSRLERCRLQNMRIQNAQLGSGREMSEFIECTFDSSSMVMGPGGFARYVRCSFRDVNIRSWFCSAVEMIDCTFSGKLQKAIFSAAVGKADQKYLGRIRNEFHGNDFSSLDLVDVSFRNGIDLTRQQLPTGPQYLFLLDPSSTLERARSEVTKWDVEQLRRAGLAILDGLIADVKGGQMQLLLRSETYFGYASLPTRAVEDVFSLLRAAGK